MRAVRLVLTLGLAAAIAGGLKGHFDAVLGPTPFTTKNVFGMIALVLIALAGLGAVGHGVHRKVHLRTRALMTVLLLYIALLTVRGLAEGNDLLNGVVVDTGPHIALLSLIVLIADEGCRLVIVRMCAAACLVCIPGVLIGLRGVDLGHRDTVLQTPGYLGTHVLVVWPILTWFTTSRRLKWLGWAACATLLFTATLAQKRAPFALTLVQIALPALLVGRVRGLVRPVVGLTAIALLAFPVMSTAAAGLRARFTADSPTILITEDDRADEVRWMLEGMDSVDVTFGLGMGGAVVSPVPIPWKDHDLIVSPHIGWAGFLLKGGIVLVVLLSLLFVWAALGRGGRHPTMRAARGIVISYATFMLVGTWWGTPVPGYTVSLGVALGLLSMKRPPGTIDEETEVSVPDSDAASEALGDDGANQEVRPRSAAGSAA